ncbi:MAG TPA: DUF2917 domain-containing protein [Tepidisphaeraceae bacterium]|jgi:hypothetical protein
MRPCCDERLSRGLTPPVVHRTIPATDHAPREFELPQGALWSTQAARIIAIACDRGELWITQSGDERDHVIAEGESFTAAPRGRVVVQALSSARVRLLA